MSTQNDEEINDGGFNFNEINKLNSELNEFREKWQQELQSTGGVPPQSQNPLIMIGNEKNIADQNEEDKAKFYFLQGIELENRGNVFDAMRSYRKAIQIVPDIEFRIYESTKLQNNQNENLKSENSNKLDDDIEEDVEDECLDGVDLMLRFKLALQKNERMIEKLMDKGVILSSDIHFGDLPTEIILYILRWVVSADLDMISLEKCSEVCKGLYICARDPEIWRQACAKVWGVNLGILTGSPFISWREMFMKRPRVQYNGCYISKTSYLRSGENSFQDQFYRPIQLVEYYRYLRFFPDGKVFMMTSAEDPMISVNKLKQKNTIRNDILTGQYRLHNNIISIILKRSKPLQKFDNHRNRRANILDSGDSNMHTFYIEMEIQSSKKRQFCQLQWKQYSIIQIKNNRETHTDFEITPQKYPSFWFSRVKSYHAEADTPLNY